MRALRWGLGTMGALLGTAALIGGSTLAVRARSRRQVRLGKTREAGLPLLDSGPESLPGLLWQATGDRLVPGNRVDWLFDAEVFDAIAQAIEVAERSIRIALYIWKPGHPGAHLAALCARRAEEGLRVQILVDPLGSEGFAEHLLPMLEAAGCEVRAFRKMGAVSALRMTGRHHRKLVVVDDRVAFTGGFAFAPDWAGHPNGSPPWRDTHARMEGPVVVDVLQSFAATWLEVSGELLSLCEGRPERPPPLPPANAGDVPTSAPDEAPEGTGHSAWRPGPLPGKAWAGFVASREAAGWTDSFMLVWLAMASAKRRLWVANAYFAPPAEILELLCLKARAGVDVRLLLPGPKIDHAVSRWAQRATYALLLKSGARIFEYQPSMMHAKTLLVDDRLSLVGSINLDPFSLYWLEEGSLVVDDPEVAAGLEARWEVDLKEAEEIRTPQRFGLLHPRRWGPRSLPRRLAALLR